MGTALRKAQHRNTVRQALVQSTFAKPAEAASEYERSVIVATTREARAVLKGFATTWIKRDGSPGKFHNRDHAKPGPVKYA